MKESAKDSMTEAIGAMSRPEVLGEALKMMKDPAFMEQMKVMAQDPSFQHYMAAVRSSLVVLFLLILLTGSY